MGRYDHGTPLKSPHTVYAAIEEVGVAGFILELDTHDSLGTKSYGIQAYWLEQDRAKLAHLEPITTYQCVLSNSEIRVVDPQKPPVYQGVTRGKSRKPRAEEPLQKLHRPKQDKATPPAKTAQVGEKPLHILQTSSCKNDKGDAAKIAQVPPDETRQEAGPREGDTHRIATSIPKKKIDMPPSASADAPLFAQKEEKEEQPDLVTLRAEYATLSQQLEQLDSKKQAGQWARLYKQVQAAEARLRQAEQDTLPSLPESAEYAKQQEEPANEGGTALTPAEGSPADERQERLYAIASDLLYWKGGLKVLQQARLPKWRGYFKWQMEAKIEALQAAYAKLRAESAKPEGETL